MKKKVKVNKLLTKKIKNENEYWFNWLEMNETDREKYVARLIPVLKRSIDEATKTKPVLLEISPARLLNNCFQDLQMTMMQIKKLKPITAKINKPGVKSKFKTYKDINDVRRDIEGKK